jgi:hypothetical protein
MDFVFLGERVTEAPPTAPTAGQNSYRISTGLKLYKIQPVLLPRKGKNKEQGNSSVKTTAH